jgi:hypothetical protein
LASDSSNQQGSFAVLSFHFAHASLSSACDRIGLTVEIILNFVWLAVAATMVTLWWRQPFSAKPQRGLQLIAIAALLLILFPVISVTDDLMAAQSPAETDTTVRRDHQADELHVLFPATAMLPATAMDAFFPESGYAMRISNLPVAEVVSPALMQPVNRPPPVV